MHLSSFSVNSVTFAVRALIVSSSDVLSSWTSGLAPLVTADLVFAGLDPHGRAGLAFLDFFPFVAGDLESGESAGGIGRI